MKPGSCGPEALGIQLVIYDDNGNEIPKGTGKAGYICVRNPWPGRMLTVWGQDQRFIDTYYAKFIEGGQQGLAGLAVHVRRRRHGVRGRLLPDPGPDR